jgi:hypothetical protein
MKTLTIPDHWTPDEALSFVAFLEELIQAIWIEHGPLMARRLRRAENHSLLGASRCPPHFDPNRDLEAKEREFDAQMAALSQHSYDDEIPF